MSASAISEEMCTNKDAYHRDGFAVMRGVFSVREINELGALLDPLFCNFEHKLSRKIRDVGALEGMQPGSQQPEIDRATLLEPGLFESAVFRKVQGIASDVLNHKARYVFDHAICKMPHTETNTVWHQDRGYMKANTTLDTVNFWIPLQDVTPENGTLNYVPGSHEGEFLDHHGDSTLHPHVLTAEVEPENVCSPSLEAGDICFHHPLTIHSAGPNRTDRSRLAWSVHFGSYGRLEYLKPANLLNMIRKGLPQL